MINFDDDDDDFYEEEKRAYLEAENRQKARDTYAASVSGTFDELDYVDLGLSDGTLFATCNAGAKNPWDRGVSHGSLPDSWEKPNKAQLKILLKECRWIPACINSKMGFIIQGPNKNEMFLPTSKTWIKPLPYRPGDYISLTTVPEDDEYVSSEGGGLDICYEAQIIELDFADKLCNEFCRPVLKFTLDSPEVFANLNQNLEAVDLGLSRKWSPKNLGSRDEYAMGWLFRWGNTEIVRDRNLYISDKDKERYVHEKNEDWSGNEKYDAASQILGNGWKTPTKQDLEELITRCKREKKFIDNVFYGYEIIGPSGKSIFLPLTDAIYHESRYVWTPLTGGSYWSSSSCSEEDATLKMAWHLHFNNDKQEVDWTQCWKAMAIRPVHD